MLRAVDTHRHPLAPRVQVCFCVIVGPTPGFHTSHLFLGRRACPCGIILDLNFRRFLTKVAGGYNECNDDRSHRW